MTNITANFNQILSFAQEYGLPAGKKRAIIREYLQTKVISYLYRQKSAAKLFFVGGTALRLLFGLDRFSEDLDFDAPELSKLEIKNLVAAAVAGLTKEHLSVDLYQNPREKKDCYELRFPAVLPELGISRNKNEKLMVKLDFETGWKGQTRQVVLLNRYGVLANVVTKTPDQFLVEKLAAFMGRKAPQARDIYDLVWLKSHGAKPDVAFAKANELNVDQLLTQAKSRFARGSKATWKSGLRPFLLDETKVDQIGFLPQVL
ncbi:MAG: nucleotidyl transferase AbiEii/AbiGii toxin family protein [Patescibacteria group bacterium]|nr:nucleotidyl transferase AbiEii/AbiGii toxin family protein [Patescibacteria group bacterium]